jgi:hypothetical protein
MLVIAALLRDKEHELSSQPWNRDRLKKPPTVGTPGQSVQQSYIAEARTNGSRNVSLRFRLKHHYSLTQGSVPHVSRMLYLRCNSTNSVSLFSIVSDNIFTAADNCSLFSVNTGRTSTTLFSANTGPICCQHRLSPSSSPICLITNLGSQKSRTAVNEAQNIAERQFMLPFS